MKNKFSKFINLQGKYLTSLLFVLLFGVGQMWGTDPTMPTACMEFPTNSTYMSSLQFNGSSYTNKYYLSPSADTLILNHYLMNQSSETNGKKIKWITYNDKGSSGTDWNADFGFKGKNYWGVNSQANVRSDRVSWYRIKGASKFVALYNQSGSSKQCIVSAYEITYVGETPSKASSAAVTRTKQSSNADTIQLTLDSSKEYIIEITGSSTSGYRMPEIMFIAPTCAATAPGNISKGALSAGVLTLNASGYGSKPTTDEWYWQTAADGVDKSNSGASFNVSAAGTYYVRSLYNNNCWSDAKSITINATDLVENYTVIYKDGTTELGSETVAVGSKPTATGITTTKEFYTFAAWQLSNADKALTDDSWKSVAADAEVTLNARYTGNYTFGTYEFTGNLTMGTAPKAMTIANSSDGQNYEAGVIDNIVVSAQKIGYEATGDYGGWKFKTQNGTLRFLVENKCAVRVTLGEANPFTVSYVANESAITDGNAPKSAVTTFIVDANSVVELKNATSNKTVTLKKLEILDVYTATYTDETGDASGSESNVTEVTLPAPTETTVDGKNFTGWKANVAVTVDDEEVAANTLIAAGKTAILSAATTFTAQWATISDFDVKFYQGYGEPDVQIGTTQVISTGNYATAPEDPERTGYVFLGWSYDATVAHIVTVSEYLITAATNFTAMWNPVWAVTFDGAGEVLVENSKTVSAPDAPTQDGKVFQGWYNGENKYDFSAEVTTALALTSKWADADPNHYVYAYDDAVRFDGVAYHTPEGKATDPDAGEATLNLPNSLTLFSGAEGITSIEATKAVYDYKKAANTKHVTAYLKLKKSTDDTNSKLIFTIASGYTAVLKVKMGGYSNNPTVTLKKGDDAITAESGTIGGTATGKNYNEITYNLTSGVYEMTTTGQTLYFSNIDLEATVIPAKVVTYKAGEGTGDDVVDNDATEVLGCPNTFTAPEGKIFNGWKDGDDNDVEVGAVVNANMTLTAQWINHYAVTFNMKDHGSAIASQDIKHGEKATKPADPAVIGWEFGGWFTDTDCTEGNEFNFNNTITAATELFAKWTEFTGCVELWPATSGDAPAVGDEINMQSGSNGATMTVMAVGSGTFAYTSAGLQFGSNAGPKVRVVLNNEMSASAGTKISVTLVAGGTGTRGLNLYDANDNKINAFTCWTGDATNGAEKTFTYTVVENDGLDGANEFQLARNNTVYLKALKVESCGAAIVYHNLTSAVNIAGKGTVTLGATSVREGYSTTATYSEIDPLYEFVNWTVSGEGASLDDATANPVNVTVGSEDAVVTLNLQLIPVKYTVNYYDGATALGTEQVNANENPTASEIATAKRHYTFQGWSETDGGDVVALNTITRTEATTVNLYAKYEAVACPTSGTIFSVEIDDTKIPEQTVKVAKNGGTLDVADYVIISDGKAMFINDETSDKDAISNGGQFKLVATKAVLKVELDCALQENDIIRIDNNQKWVVSTSKTKTGTYQALTSSQHEFAVTAAWAGVDDLYFLYDGSSLSFSQIEVYRPGKFDVSFDLMGHGSAAIADIEDVLEGSKITAPTAPEDADFAFAGWYKENTLENEWDFDNDVVSAATTLYAKWLDKSDATLKSLKYGTTEIELQAGIYEYNVELPALTTAVPALTAETSNPNAEAAISNATAFDEAGNATSTVEVTPEKEGAAHLTYTVNFSKAVVLEQVDVTGTTEWNFALAGNTADNQTDVVLANLPGITNDATFNSQALRGTFNKLQGDGNSYQGSVLQFHTTVPGMLILEFGGTNGNTRHLDLTNQTGDVVASWTYNSSKKKDNVKDTIAVPAGDVILRAYEGEGAQNARIYYMKFDTDFSAYELTDNKLNGYTRNIAEGEYGTICLPKAGVMVGASLFEVAYFGQTSKKIFFDEIINGEMEAGKPYIFQLKEGESDFKVFYTNTVEAVAGAEGTYFTNGTTPAYASANGLIGYIGTDDYYQVPAGEDYYIIYNNQYHFVQAGADARIVSTRACIKMNDINPVETALAPGRRRVSMGGEAPQVATGVEGLNVGDQPVKVIINGQLFILRGEKMYDTTGRLVK